MEIRFVSEMSGWCRSRDNPRKFFDAEYFLPVKALGLFLVFTTSMVCGQGPAFPVASTPQELSPLMERELRGCFDFFWEEWNADPKSPTYGMTNGDYVGMNKYSPLAIEEQGFYFAAIIIGVERGWITRKEGEERKKRGSEEEKGEKEGNQIANCKVGVLIIFNIISFTIF